MGDIRAPPGEEIVDAQDFRPGLEQPFAQEGADEPGAAGNEDTRDIMHPAGVRAFS